MSHNADGSVKMRSFMFTAYVRTRYHSDDPDDIPVGGHKDADRVLELHGARDDHEVGEFVQTVRMEGRRLYGVLIGVLED
jgi:hypothetical protein